MCQYYLRISNGACRGLGLECIEHVVLERDMENRAGTVVFDELATEGGSVGCEFAATLKSVELKNAKLQGGVTYGVSVALIWESSESQFTITMTICGFSIAWP